MNPFRVATPEVPVQPINHKVASVKAKVDEVMGAMQANIDLALERGEALESIHIQTGNEGVSFEFLENLQAQSEQFKRAATQTQRKLWWKNVTRNLIVLSLILLIVGGLAAFLILYGRQWQSL